MATCYTSVCFFPVISYTPKYCYLFSRPGASVDGTLAGPRGSVKIDCTSFFFFFFGSPIAYVLGIAYAYRVHHNKESLSHIASRFRLFVTNTNPPMLPTSSSSIPTPRVTSNPHRNNNVFIFGRFPMRYHVEPEHHGNAKSKPSNSGNY